LVGLVSEELHKHVVGEPFPKHVGQKRELGNHGTLEDNGSVAGLKYLDSVGVCIIGVTLSGEGDSVVPPLHMQHNHDHQNGSEQVHDVLASLSEECVRQSHCLIFCQQFVHQVNKDAFKGSFIVITCDCYRREYLPQDTFGDVDSYEDADAVA